MNFNNAHKVGDMVKIIDDPSSFVVGEKFLGAIGVIVDYDQDTEIYTVFLSESSQTFRVLDFMMEKIFE